MVTRSRRTLPVLVVVIVLVWTSFAATGIALAEPPRNQDAHQTSETNELTIEAFDHPFSSSNSLETISTGITSIVLLAGLNRSDGSHPLEHDIRKEIHDEIRQSSGTFVSDLQATCDIHRSTLRYHLDILERSDLISSQTIFGKSWCYPSGGDNTELRAALANDATEEVLTAIARLEPVNVTALASEVERSSSTVSYHLDRLAEEELIEQERRSATVLTRVAPDIRTELETSADSIDWSGG